MPGTWRRPVQRLSEYCKLLLICCGQGSHHRLRILLVLGEYLFSQMGNLICGVSDTLVDLLDSRSCCFGDVICECGMVSGFQVHLKPRNVSE